MSFQDWYHAAQRDFTILSINGKYQPIGNVFRTTLPRILLQAGLVPPEKYQARSSHRAGAGLSSTDGYTDGPSDECGPFGAAIQERLMSSLHRLKPRPGMVEAFTNTYRTKINGSNIDVWGATNGSLALAQNLFRGALGDQLVIYADENAGTELVKNDTNGIGLISCDDFSVAKPDPRVYREIKKRLSSPEKTSLWFVASHTWDLFAARQAGFKTAWVSYEEFDTCSDIFGTPDIIGSDLNQVAQKIVDYESKG